MRNGQNVLWWFLGIYLIFSVTFVALGQSVPSESDAASHDPALLQSQMTKIMDKIHEVELQLHNHIDQKHSDSKKEDTLRDDVKKEIETLGTEIKTLFENQSQMHELEKTTSSLQTRVAVLEAMGIGFIIAMIVAVILALGQWMRQTKMRDPVAETQPPPASSDQRSDNM